MDSLSLDLPVLHIEGNPDRYHTRSDELRHVRQVQVAIVNPMVLRDVSHDLGGIASSASGPYSPPDRVRAEPRFLWPGWAPGRTGLAPIRGSKIEKFRQNLTFCQISRKLAIAEAATGYVVVHCY